MEDIEVFVVAKRVQGTFTWLCKCHHSAEDLFVSTPEKHWCRVGPRGSAASPTGSGLKLSEAPTARVG